MKAHTLTGRNGMLACRWLFSLCVLTAHQIRFFLVYNTKGITRLSKFYVPSPDNEKKAIIKQLHDMIMKRDATQPRYFPVRSHPSGCQASPRCSPLSVLTSCSTTGTLKSCIDATSSSTFACASKKVTTCWPTWSPSTCS